MDDSKDYNKESPRAFFLDCKICSISLKMFEAELDMTSLDQLKFSSKLYLAGLIYSSKSLIQPTFVE